MSVGRRGFLRLLAAAPVAAPVVAREAALKAGVGNVVGYAAPSMLSGASQAGLTPDHGDWLKSWAVEVFSKQWEEQQRAEVMSNPVGVLDADLASSRSLSLSTAIRMQRERNFERMVKNHQRSVLDRFKKTFGFDFVPEEGA